MHTNDSNDKVVSLFRAKDLGQSAKASAEETSSAESFSDVMKRNQENLERLRKERLKANQSVLKSYKIKH